MTWQIYNSSGLKANIRNIFILHTDTFESFEIMLNFGNHKTKFIMRWRKFDGTTIEKPLLEAVKETLVRETEAGNRMKVCIGTDSEVRQDGVEFATVIVFLREKKGGFMYIRNQHSNKPMSLKERMISEVSMSVEVAYSLCDMLDMHDVGLEVHADINTDPHFKSNEALKEAMGYILGMGFVFKAKPDAFASSNCADKVV
ncbi:MAG: ribonuclease H-like YkuK family protein [Saprospiraceae bacterium]